MFAVSQDFAPPFKLVAPYFIIGCFFLIFSILSTYLFDLNSITHLNSEVLSFTHLFLLGFVMMIIFGAMAQLIPVTLEVGHFSIEFYYIIYPLLLIGSLLMAFGFLVNSDLLPFGGTVVLISMLIYLLEFFLTIKKVEKFNNIIKILIISNIFLLIGIIIGVILALGHSGAIVIDIYSLLKAHVFLLLLGYICLTIMALSLVLLPMFGLSHGFSQKPLNLSVILLTIAVITITIAVIFKVSYIDYIGYVLAFIGLNIYLYQIILIYKTRARKENDIYVKNLLVAFFTFLISIILGIFYLLSGNETFVLASVWLLFFGFFSFIIIGHLYKIVPFLVWFDKFSALVGKQKVPMLVDMIPTKGANFQFFFFLVGLVVSTFAILITNDELFKAGITFIVVAAIFLLKNILYMIRFK